MILPTNESEELAHIRLELRNCRLILASLRAENDRLNADMGATRAENSRLRKHVEILEQQIVSAKRK